MARIDAFLKLGTQQGCSDIHLAVGVPPMLRHARRSVPIKFRDLRDAELESYVTEILTKNQSEHFARGNDLDFSYVSAEGGRFRVNVFRKDTGVGATFRAIPAEVPTLEARLPPVVTKLLRLPPGHDPGDRLDRHRQVDDAGGDDRPAEPTRKLNIISLEDPIEFVHRSKSAQVIQRELGTHIPSFAEGVRAAMREDPDVILVGELRDAETIRMAMTAAETGHLVLGTLHTTSAVKTIDRIIDALPAEEREQTKSFLAQSLLAVVTQMLVKTHDGRGRRAICEIMVMTKAIAKLIQTDQTHQIPSQLQTGKEFGMQMLDQALLAARAGQGDRSGRRLSSTRPTSALFQKFVTDTSMLPKLDMPRPAGLGRSSADAAHGQIDEYLEEVLSAAARTCISSPATRRASASTATCSRCAPTADGRLRQGNALRDHAAQGGRALRGKDGADFAYTLPARAAFASMSCAS
jgi:twitching motility protein PilT